MADDEKYVTPIDKIYKRLVNGPEDNVVSFYQMMMKKDNCCEKINIVKMTEWKNLYPIKR